MYSHIRIFSACLSILFCFIFSWSCKNLDNDDKPKSEIESLKSLGLNSTMDSLLEAYISEYPHYSDYAILFDKKSEGNKNYVVTIAPFQKKLKNLNESGAAIYFSKKDGTLIFLYSGIEDFLTVGSNLLKDTSFPKDQYGDVINDIYWDPIRTKIDLLKSWAFVQTDSQFYLVKENIYPYSPINLLPTMEFGNVSDTFR